MRPPSRLESYPVAYAALQDLRLAAHRTAARPDAGSTAVLILKLRSGSRGASRFANPVRKTWSRREGTTGGLPRSVVQPWSAAREAPAVTKGGRRAPRGAGAELRNQAFG